MTSNSLKSQRDVILLRAGRVCLTRPLRFNEAWQQVIFLVSHEPEMYSMYSKIRSMFRFLLCSACCKHGLPIKNSSKKKAVITVGDERQKCLCLLHVSLQVRGAILLSINISFFVRSARPGNKTSIVSNWQNFLPSAAAAANQGPDLRNRAGSLWQPLHFVSFALFTPSSLLLSGR